MIKDYELSGYMDGELEPDRVQAVEHALAADPGIAAKLERLRVADQLLSNSAREIVCHDFLDPQPEERNTQRPEPLIRTLAGTAVLALILVLVKFAIGSVEPWVASGLELMLLATLLALAITRFQSMVNDDLAKVEEVLGRTETSGASLTN